MFFLTFDVSNMMGKAFFVEGKDTVLFLPCKRLLERRTLVNPGRGGSFDLANESGDGELRRDGNDEVNVVGHAI